MAQVCSLFPHSVDYVLNGRYVPFHSLNHKDIGEEGYSILTAALQQCEELQILRWV